MTKQYTLFNFNTPDKKKTALPPLIFQKEISIKDIDIDKNIKTRLSKQFTYFFPNQVEFVSSFFQIPIDPNVVESKITYDIHEDKIILKRHDNYLITTETSSGKTIIAILYIAKMLEESKKGTAVYAVPMRSLGSEKYRDFVKIFSGFADVQLIMGNEKKYTGKKGKKTILITTNEKFDQLLRDDDTLKDVVCVVFDELHLLNTNRGTTIEWCVSKIKDAKIPRMGLSATIENDDEISKWLDAGLISSPFRPIPIKYGFISDKIYYSDQFGNTKEIKEIGRTYISKAKNPIDAFLSEKIQEEESVLYFRQSQSGVVATAKRVASMIKKIKRVPNNYELPEVKGKDGIDHILNECIKWGIAFHHAGLSSKNKSYIEKLFRKRKICVIVATPTLCMPSTEMIFTDASLNSISNLENCKVLTKDGTYQQVTETFERRFDGELIKVYSNGNLPSTMTQNHQVLISKKSIKYTNGGKKKHWVFSDPTWICASEIKKNDYVLFPIIKDNINTKYIELKSLKNTSNQHGTTNSKHWASNRIPPSIELTDELLELMGLFVAEGSTGTNGVVKIDIDSRKEDLRNFVIKTFEKSFGITPTITISERHRCDIGICSKSVSKSFREWFGVRAENKKIPAFIQKLPNDRIIPFIRGYFNGDGNITKPTKKVSSYARCTTVSINLAKQIFSLLIKMKYHPMLTKTLPKKKKPSKLNIASKLPQYHISVSGKSGRLFLKEIFNIDVEFHGNRQYNTTRFAKGYYMMRVTKTEKVEYHGNVYNIEVKNNPNYVSSFIVHNSIGVNVPAKIVVMEYRAYRDGVYDDLPVVEIRQMMGRAARPKYDREGFAFIYDTDLNQGKQEHLYNKYFEGKCEPIISQYNGFDDLLMSLLGFVSSTQKPISQSKILSLYKNTLVYHQSQVFKENVKTDLEDAIEYLSTVSPPLIKKSNKKWVATEFGEMIGNLYIHPSVALNISDFITDSHYTKDDFSTVYFLYSYGGLRPLRKKSSDTEMIENTINMIEEYNVDLFGGEHYNLSAIKTASCLIGSEYHDFVTWAENDSTEDDMMEAYDLSSGDFYRLVKKGGNLHWIIHSYYKIAKYHEKEDEVNRILNIQTRLQYGISEELIPLCKIKWVGKEYGMKLFDLGFRTPSDFKESDVEKISLITNKDGSKMGEKTAQKIVNNAIKQQN